MRSNLKISEVTQYNWQHDVLPPKLNGQLRNSFFYLTDALQTEKPKFIDTLAVYNPRWYDKPTSLDFFVFGNFRSRYNALVQTAEFLAAFYLQNDFLPIIQPLTNRDWMIQIETNGKLYHNLLKAGILIYSTEGN